MEENTDNTDNTGNIDSKGRQEQQVLQGHEVQERKLARWVWIASVGAIVANFIAEYFEIFGTETREISARNQTLITPSGTAFSIWSLIYVGTLVFSYWQSQQAKQAHDLAKGTRQWMILAGVMNGTFPFLFHAEWIAMAWLAVVGLAIALIPVYRQLYDARSSSWKERLMGKAPIALYLGWVSAAGAVATAQVLAKAGMGFAPANGAMWALVVEGVVLLVATGLAYRFGDGVLPITIGWAFYWIYDSQRFGERDLTLLMAVFLISLGILQIGNALRKGLAAGKTLPAIPQEAEVAAEIADKYKL